jgi:vacuolar-type H+-ATPase subunit H
VELERLIETEQRNEALLRQAQEQAETLIRSARTAADDRVAALAGELEQATRRSETELASERERRTAEIREAAHQQAARYEAVPDERVRMVAKALVDSLLAGDEP